MSIDKDKLRALAEEAGKTTGWYQVGSFGLSEVSGKAEQAFIAAATPETILTLIAEIEHLQDLVAEWRRSSPVLPSRACAAIIDQLKAENEALRKQNEELPKTIKAQLEVFLGEAKRDAERYRFVRKTWCPDCPSEKADAKIDAAMAKEASHG